MEPGSHNTHTHTHMYVYMYVLDNNIEAQIPDRSFSDRILRRCSSVHLFFTVYCWPCSLTLRMVGGEKLTDTPTVHRGLSTPSLYHWWVEHNIGFSPITQDWASSRGAEHLPDQGHKSLPVGASPRFPWASVTRHPLSPPEVSPHDLWITDQTSPQFSEETPLPDTVACPGS